MQNKTGKPVVLVCRATPEFSWKQQRGTNADANERQEIIVRKPRMFGSFNRNRKHGRSRGRSDGTHDRNKQLSDSVGSSERSSVGGGCCDIDEDARIPQIQYHRGGKLHSDQGPNHPTQSLGSSESVDQWESKNHRNAGSYSDRIDSLGPESIVQIRKEEDLEQPVHHAIDGKNIADTWRIETKSPKFCWCSKEERLYGSECHF